MTDETAPDRAVVLMAILNEHGKYTQQRTKDDPDRWEALCTCGEVLTDYSNGPFFGQRHRAHQAEVLASLLLGHGETSAKETVLNDLRDRLTRADWELKGLSEVALEHSGSGEARRLAGKAQGVQLALSYVDEALRALH